jgi:asparagine synthase (glutamine-hydrolysing)
MCGFAGILCLDGSRPDEALLQRMGSVLAHRGPDDSGLHVAGPCGLVHRRLSIIDLSAAGRQPFLNEQGDLALAYNGEVYNFLEMKARHRLETLGHTFRSRTDTEVLLHLYEQIGEAMLPELNGMFAFAAWHSGRGELLLARDPFGIKPLFYCVAGGSFLFASEIKALLEAPQVGREPDRHALFDYLSLDYIPGERTAFRGISELRPGHCLLADTTGIRRITRYHEHTFSPRRGMTEEEAADGVGYLLRNAVERQLISDVPVGVMLSGGMDSSSIAVLMDSVMKGQSFHTFSIGFDDASFDESPWARFVAGRIGSTHHSISVTPQAVAALLPEYLAYIDEPYGDGSAIPTLMLAREAREFVTVLLSGEGGDEVLAGYDTYAAYKVRSIYRKIPAFVRRGLIAPLAAALPVSHSKLSFDFRAKRFVSGAELGVPESHFSWRAILADEAKKDIMAESAGGGWPPTSRMFADAWESCGAADELNKLLCLDMSFHLPDDLMIKNDRMTMASSIEARVPFTDLELVSFLATVPVELKLPGLRKKNLLRKAMKGLLPEEILRKKKVGLEMPYSRWLRSELRPYAARLLSPERTGATGLFDPAGINLLWSEHLEMKRDHGRALWGLLNYMIWFEMYITSSDYREVLAGNRRLEKG